jgi:hypothetical protein
LAVAHRPLRLLRRTIAAICARHLLHREL